MSLILSHFGVRATRRRFAPGDLSRRAVPGLSETVRVDEAKLIAAYEGAPRQVAWRKTATSRTHSKMGKDKDQALFVIKLTVG